jgi:hypothetical protein
MGYRDNTDLDDEQVDALMARVLGDMRAPVLPPPDLVTRTARRLPPVPPRIAAQHAQHHHMFRKVVLWFLAVATVFVVLIGVAGIFSGNPYFALLFGDGSHGLSQMLLSLSLLAKPIVRAPGMLGYPVIFASLSVLVGSIWLWVRLLPLPAYVYAEK